MSEIFDEVRKLADLENGILPSGEKVDQHDVPEFLLADAQGKIEALGKADPRGVWDILRNGTEDEFSALCNCLPEIGGEFETDDSHREVMRIARRRLANAQNYENVMAGIKGGFGHSFDRFWKETEVKEDTRKHAKSN